MGKCLATLITKKRQLDKVSIYQEFPSLLAFKRDFDKLGLIGDDLWLLYDQFCNMDEDKSQSISLEELFEYLKIRETPFIKRCFSLFDEDGNDEVDFREFVVTLWNYCTLNKNSLLLFAFDLYDGDSSGKIDISEVGGILKDLYGDQFLSNPNAQRIFNNFSNFHRFCPTTTDGFEEDLDIRQFKEFVECHPMLLWPAFQIQEILRERFGGKHLWNKLSRIRIHVSDGEYIDVNKILSAHIEPDEFQKIIEMSALTSQTIDIVNSTGQIASRKKEEIFVNPFSYALSSTRKSQNQRKAKPLTKPISPKHRRTTSLLSRGSIPSRVREATKLKQQDAAEHAPTSIIQAQVEKEVKKRKITRKSKESPPKWAPNVVTPKGPHSKDKQLFKAPNRNLPRTISSRHIHVSRIAVDESGRRSSDSTPAELSRATSRRELRIRHRTHSPFPSSPTNYHLQPIDRRRAQTFM